MAGSVSVSKRPCAGEKFRANTCRKLKNAVKAVVSTRI
jgi:hypothetical protein